MEDHKKMPFTQILIEVKVEVVELHFEGDIKVRMVNIINMKVNLMDVNEETLKEEQEEAVEAIMKVIEVNNQITTQTIITMGNLGTW
jgi:hypothetical protein